MSKAKPDVNFRIASALGSLFGFSSRARDEWLDTPNPDFDDLTPHELVANGKSEILAEWLEDRLLGHPE